jgi:hypothetical protein
MEPETPIKTDLVIQQSVFQAGESDTAFLFRLRSLFFMGIQGVCMGIQGVAWEYKGFEVVK